MSYVHFSFDTPGFKDSREVKARNINELAGHALAMWLSSELKARGVVVSDVWDEDHGWDFAITAGGGKYQCACSINDDEAPIGDAHVVIGPKAPLALEVVTVIGSILEGWPDVTKLEVETYR
jgi:hypothetical protein